MTDKIVRKTLDINDKFLKLSNDEKLMFKNAEGRCSVYKTKTGKLEPEFSNPNKRSKMVLQFLAAHSEDIGTDSMDDSKQNSFIFLTFDGDREIMRAAKDTEKYKSKVIWRSVDSVKESEPIYKYAQAHVYQKNMVTLILRVNQTDSTDILFINSYRFSPFELYTNVLIPWKIPIKLKEDSDEIKVVMTNLSMYQSKLFFDEKNKCNFYPTKNPDVFEPYITNNNTRNSIIYEIIGILIDNRIFEEDDANDTNKIICLRFADGDRQFINMLIAMNSKRFWFYEDLNTFSNDKTKIDLIRTSVDTAKKNNKGERAFLVEWYVPGTNECFLYTSFAKEVVKTGTSKDTDISLTYESLASAKDNMVARK